MRHTNPFSALFVPRCTMLLGTHGVRVEGGLEGGGGGVSCESASAANVTEHGIVAPLPLVAESARGGHVSPVRNNGIPFQTCFCHAEMCTTFSSDNVIRFNSHLLKRRRASVSQRIIDFNFIPLDFNSAVTLYKSIVDISFTSIWE